MIEIAKDKKSDGYILTQTDAEGFHKQLNLSKQEYTELRLMFNRTMLWK